MSDNDPFQYHQRGTGSPAFDAFAVTPSNGNDLPRPARALYVGTGGDVNVVTLAGNTVLFRGVSGSLVLPCGARRVLSNNTTASDIVALV